MPHGPEPCANCGVTHTPVVVHYDENGEPSIDFDEPEGRLVVLYGMTDDGRTLYVEADLEDTGAPPA